MPFPQLYIYLIIAGVILILLIIIAACCFKRYAENPDNIKWKRARTEAKLKQIEESK